MSALPKGWLEVSLGQITSKPQYGYTTKSQQGGSVRYLRTTDLTSGKINWDNVPFCADDPADVNKYQLEDRDIVISRAGSVGFHSLIYSPPEKVVFASYLIRFKPSSLVNERYLSRYLNSNAYWSQITEKAAGVAVQNVNAVKLSDLRIPLAPTNEQNLIAEKLDSILTKVERAQARLDKIPGILKRFRQSVLAAATSGELTKEWREDNHQSKVCLHSILQYWSDEYLKQRKKYRTQNLKKIIEPNFILPTTWIYTSLGLIGDVHVGATPSRNQPLYWKGDIPWVSSSEVAFCKIKNTKETITELGLANASTTIHPPGTVMLAMIGQGKTRGQAAILEIDAAHNQNTAAIRVSDKFLLSEYLYYYLWSQYEQTRKIGGGNNQQALNKASVQNLPLPVPPISEQTEIVCRIKVLFEQAEKAEKLYLKAKDNLDRLTSSILEKAFRGELVSQDPDDESVEKLLDRIKTSNSSTKSKKK